MRSVKKKKKFILNFLTTYSVEYEYIFSILDRSRILEGKSVSEIVEDSQTRCY